MSDLKADLMDIQGVGDATAKSVLEVLGEHDTDADADPLLERAIAQARAGNNGRAAAFLKRYADNND